MADPPESGSTQPSGWSCFKALRSRRLEGLAKRGTPRRLACLFRVLAIWREGNPPPAENLCLLVDYNAHKLGGWKESGLGNVDAFFHVFKCKPCPAERLGTLLAVLLPPKLFRAMQCTLIAKSVAGAIPESCTIALWNPYTHIHFAICHLRPIESCFLQTSEYPLPPNVEHFFGCRTAGEAYALSGIEFTATHVPHEIVESLGEFQICLTQWQAIKSRNYRSDIALLEFADYLKDRNIPVTIYLHYRDRYDPQLDGFPDRLRHLVSREPVLENVSCSNVSVSGSSSVGLQLASLNESHFFHLDEGYPDRGGPWKSWVSAQRNFLRPDEDFDQWVLKISDLVPWVKELNSR